MDPQELLALLGYSDAPVGFDGEPIPQDLPAPGTPLPPGSVNQGPAIDQGYGGATVDFQPKQYDFGNHAAQNYEYDSQGNLVEQLPSGGAFNPRPGQSFSTKERVSSSGYSPEKMAQIEAGPMGTSKMAQKKVTAADAITARYADDQARIQAAGDAAMRDEEALGRAEGAQIEERALGQRKVASLWDQHYREMEGLSQSALIAKQKAADEYRMRLSTIPELNPNAMWDDAGPGGQFQIAVAAVVHNMLAVKGINTSAMDTINGAIKNKMDAQIYNINNKKAVAQGFKDLYDMTVADSASQMEVRAKMHGYMLKALEAGIDADMGKIDSTVARLKHAQAKNIIRQAQVKNMLEVESHIGREVDQAFGREVTMRGQNMTAATARADREQQMKIAEIRANAEKPSAGPPVIYDTSKSGGGAAKWRIKPQYADDKELQRDVIRKTVLTNKAIDGFRELQDLQKEIDGSPPAIAGRLRSELVRREEALRSTVVSAMVLDTSGKAVTNQEYDRISATVPVQGWFSNGNNRKIIASRVKEKQSEMNDLLQQTADDIGQDDPAFGTLSARNRFAESEGIEADIIKEDDGSITSREMAEKSLGTLGTFAPDDTVTKDEQAEWNEFRATYPKEAKKILDKRGDNAVSVGGTKVGVKSPTEDMPPQALGDLRLLALQAVVEGDQDSRAALEKIANPDKNTPPELKELSGLAHYYVDWMTTQAGRSSTMEYEAR